MRITRAADYGVRIMSRLAAAPPGTRLTVAALAADSQSTVAFTGKILQRLVGARVVVSHRGFEGGFELARAADQITLLDIVEALDGSLCLNECMPNGAGCDRVSSCGAYGVWLQAQEALAAVLRSRSLDQMAATEQAG